MPLTANGFDEDNEEDDDHYDDRDDEDDNETGECPECHAEVYLIAECCPKCGHWFEEDQRPAMSRASQPRWSKVVKAVSIGLLAAIAVGIVAAVVAN